MSTAYVISLHMRLLLYLFNKIYMSTAYAISLHMRLLLYLFNKIIDVYGVCDIFTYEVVIVFI